MSVVARCYGHDKTDAVYVLIRLSDGSFVPRAVSAGMKAPGKAVSPFQDVAAPVGLFPMRSWLIHEPLLPRPNVIFYSGGSCTVGDRISVVWRLWKSLYSPFQYVTHWLLPDELHEMIFKSLVECIGHPSA